jgi:hypothetical protein
VRIDAQAVVDRGNDLAGTDLIVLRVRREQL